MGRAQKLLAQALDHYADECLIWPYAVDGNGYPKMNMGGETVAVHRYICRREHGPPPPDTETAHKCGTKRCIARKHVRWKTRQGNMDEVVSMGRSNRGAKTHTNKLTEQQVREIRSLAGKKLHREIAGRYGVSTVQITRIINRQSWNWLT